MHHLSALLASLEKIAGGDLDHRVPISSMHDEVDAISHAVNVLVGELQIKADSLKRAKEDAEAANDAKTVFLRNASHEIRTPLSVVLGMSELIASRDLSRHRIDMFHRRIVSNGQALTALLDDLLDLAKIEAQKLEYELRPISLRAMLIEVIASFEAEASRRRLRLALEPGAKTAPSVFADAKRVRQILTNVIGNALKFTTQGSVVIDVSCAPDRRAVVIDIADTGIGMTAEQSRLLFEPFVQADASIGRRFGGSGLGLALSKRFAEGMSGSLEVLQSIEGIGTTFRLVLPAAQKATRASATSTMPRSPRSGAELSGLRILVVEDNDEVRAMTAELLRLVGATVQEARDGDDAIERVVHGDFDSVLMDIRMPNMDGLEATRRIRARGSSVPIVALTADAVAEQQRVCTDAGCDAYLTKPLDFDKLFGLLRQLGAGRASSRRRKRSPSRSM